MISIIVDCEKRVIQIEGKQDTAIALLQHPSTVINLIKTVLDIYAFSGERICLEFKDEAGQYHTVERWS